MSGNEMFYMKNGKKQDSDLHNAILSGGSDNSKEILDRAARLGLSQREIEVLFPIASSA